jgi:glycosyltransferase involved in cell wall biosynthesis
MKINKLKIGIIANEFFDEEIGGFGGFGWLAREAVFSFRKFPEFFQEPVFLSGNFKTGKKDETVYGTKVLFPNEDWDLYLRQVQNEKIDILFSIDYRPNYDYPLAALPDKPFIFWIQDPRPLDDIKKINTLIIPGKTKIDGISAIDCTTFREVLDQSITSKRTIVYACPAPSLLDKANKTFDLHLSAKDIQFLPYPLDNSEKLIQKSDSPKLIFLGRLDPIKRPWIFTELAKYFPEIEFLLLGKAHFNGEGAWSPHELPANVIVKGHIDGSEKQKILSEASILINTSIHEALPVSFLEGLQFEMPLLSCQDPEGIVSSFGYFTGRIDGDGLNGIDKFRQGLEYLLNDRNRLLALGKQGSEWVNNNHSRSNFINLFAGIIKKLPSINSVKDIEPEPFGFPKQVQWMINIQQEIDTFLPANTTAIIIDDYQLNLSNRFKTNLTRFGEINGIYSGVPEKSDQVIKELQRKLSQQIEYLIIISPCFWWLEYYTEFATYITSNFIEIYRTENNLIFKLK